MMLFYVAIGFALGLPFYRLQAILGLAVVVMRDDDRATDEQITAAIASGIDEYVEEADAGMKVGWFFRALVMGVLWPIALVLVIGMFIWIPSFRKMWR